MKKMDKNIVIFTENRDYLGAQIVHILVSDVIKIITKYINIKN